MLNAFLPPLTPGSFHAGGEVTEINRDPFAVPAARAAPIDAAARLFLRRLNRRQRTTDQRFRDLALLDPVSRTADQWC